MTRKWAFAGVGLLGGLLALGASRLGAGAGPGDAPEAGGSDATELQELKAQVRELQASVASSERLAREAQVTVRAAASPRVEVVPVPAPVPQGVEDAGDTATAESEEEVEPDEAVARLDARFFSEAVDPGWSGDARRRAERLGGLLPQGARVVSLECRTSMCRLEMSHPSLESFQGFVREGLLGAGNDWDGPFMAALTGDPRRPGGVQAVAYLAREGADLAPDAPDAP